MRANKGPAVLRPIVMALHWSAMILAVAFLAGTLPGWPLALHALAWAAITAIWGLRGGPSPALPRGLRQIVPLGHLALLGLWLVAALVAHFEPLWAPPVLLITIGTAALHAAFNLWRAGVLGDGAFRRMLPKALH